ncbi:hypothetical protein WSK_3748 [Novosphingobium sp. Rr 2-17]|uniref:alpha/beta hydrolase n=1 Tax=Novosphingobium sp. Rr 2-17 TaxID=555793 RepID=UPI0002698265|nr:alpha/beta hydrolase [Novosphingobium sp. Rr 2-17]EIZ77738.1 hypothetical protein WSK_3748 [Novosphingobium sp. Rr 2-17]
MMAHDPAITRRVFRRRSTPEAASINMLPGEAQAGLRQFSVERLTAYGLVYEDAAELLDRVAQGEGWQDAASDMAAALPTSRDGYAPATAADQMFRKAALLRAAQFMMIEDTAQRCELFGQAAQLYASASVLARDRIRFECRGVDGAVLVGWRFPAEAPCAVAVVWGGIEGWAMDFAAMGVELARRGIEVFLIDGPGQGETRLTYGLYFDDNWQSHWRLAIDHVCEQAGDLPLFIVGNSMGGCLVMNYAPGDPRICGIVSNGGPLRPPGLTGDLPSKLRKFVVFCGEADAPSVWGALDAGRALANSRQPLLILHGSADPLVTEAEVLEIARMAGSEDVEVAIFSNGEHCLYNHTADKHDLVAEWIRQRSRWAQDQRS